MRFCQHFDLIQPSCFIRKFEHYRLTIKGTLKKKPRQSELLLQPRARWNKRKKGGDSKPTGRLSVIVSSIASVNPQCPSVQPHGMCGWKDTSIKILFSLKQAAYM